MIYFFLFNLIIIVIKKNCPTHGFNPTHMGWVGLDLCDELGWVEFFLTHLESKNPLNPTHVYPSHIKEKRSKRVKDYT